MTTAENDISVQHTLITKDMTLGEIIRRHPQSAAIFRSYGMDCNECQIADYEELEHGANVHRVDVDSLIAELNTSLEK